VAVGVTEERQESVGIQQRAEQRGKGIRQAVVGACC